MYSDPEGKPKKAEPPVKAAITDLLVSPGDDLGAAVLEGLTADPKILYPRFFYDERGSYLFEKICEQPEYYPTRTEAEILQTHGSEIIDALPGEVDLIELGSGNSRKTRILLDCLSARQKEIEYRPIDISEEILRSTAREIHADYPRVQVHGFVADFLAGLEFLKLKTKRSKLILFLGSNLGNFEYTEAADFLRSMTRAAGPGDRILIGYDLDKDPDVLEKAYNDAAGFTAEFNLNLLDRINRELDGDFDLQAFRHHAFFDREADLVEINLVSRKRQNVNLRALNRTFAFRKEERIRTEVSCKYTPARLEWIRERAGLREIRRFHDERRWFTLILYAVD